MSIPPLQTGPAAERRWEPEALLWIGWRRKFWVLVGIVLGVGLGAAAGYSLPKVYQSTAQISVVKKRPDAVTGWDTRQISTENQISPPQDLLKSSLIIDSAVRSRNLTSLSTFANEENDPTETIRNSLNVAAGRGTTVQSFVFKLTYRGKVQEDCNVVLAAVLDSYKSYMDRKHQSVSEDTIELIVREKQSLEKVIADKEEAYKQFRTSAPLISKNKDGLELRQERLNSIQTRLSAVLLQRVEVEGQLAAIEAARKEGRSKEAILAMVAEFVRKGDLADGGRDKMLNLQEQLFPLLLEERKLLELHGPKHPEVLAVQNRIEAARRLLVLPPTAWKGKNDEVSPAIDDPIALHTQLLKQKLTHLKISEELLTSVLQGEQDEARRLAAYEIQNDSFRTSITMNQQLYEALVKRLNEVSLTRDVGGYEIEMIEPPSIAKRVAPSMTLSLLVGAFAGAFLGLGLAFGVDRRDRRFRTISDVAQALGTQVISAVPKSKTLATTLTENNEAFWRLRNSLMLTSEKGGPKVIQIAGANPMVGATTVAGKLGAALAQAGKKVLLVDANLTDPSLHRLLGITNATGLSSFLANQSTLEQVIQQTSVPGLAAIPTAATGVPIGEGGMLQRFKELLATVKNQFDFVIVDTPALLDSPDGNAVARTVDAALLTIDFTTTTRPDAESAAQLLASSGTKVLGTIVNRGEA